MSDHEREAGRGASRREVLGAAAAVGVAAWPVGMAFGAAPKSKPSMGINLAGVVDWNTELPFVDVFRLSRRWISQREGAGWGKGPALEVDERGWVKRLESGCWAETPMCTIDGGHYPGGRYTVAYAGRGRLEFWGAAKVVDQAAGRMVIEVDPKKGPIWLRLKETDARDPVRDIHVVMPGFEDRYEKDPFHPRLIERWSGVSCVRFMDFMHTNGSKVAGWDDRPRVEDATWSVRGVPIEVMCDLCNRLRADAWFCMPHLADDDYVRRFAAQAGERLDVGRRIYIEYSNEVWNGIFAQHRHAAERGQAMGLASKAWEAAWRYTAVRSVEIFRIWERALGGRERLVRVLPTQAANPYVAKQIVPYREAYRHADALAIAPYAGMNVKGEDAAAAAKLGVEGVLDKLEREGLPRSIEWMKQNKQIAEEHGLTLIAYEAGQHLVGVGEATMHEPLTKVLHAANAHERMGRVYEGYYRGWEEVGGELMCHFSSIGRWSQWGSWGLMQHADDEPARYPKYVATVAAARRWGQPMRAVGGAL